TSLSTSARPPPRSSSRGRRGTATAPSPATSPTRTATRSSGFITPRCRSKPRASRRRPVAEPDRRQLLDRAAERLLPLGVDRQQVGVLVGEPAVSGDAELVAGVDQQV